jgi:hypothetical protein
MNLVNFVKFSDSLVNFMNFNDSLDYMLMLLLGYAYVMIVFICECLSSII